jgi:hypothetical protein
MASRNPYQLDPYFASGLQNLTNALIGNPETDYQVARTKYTDAQTNEINELLPFKKDQYTADIGRLNATASNQTAQAGNWNAKTAQTEALNSAATTLSQDPVFQSIASAILGIPEGQSLSPEASAAYALSLVSGGNPDQRANALETIGRGKNNRLAESMILSGDDDQAQLGALYFAPQGGEFQNPGFAEDKVEATLDKDRDVAKIQAGADVDVANVNKSSAIEVAKIQTTSAEQIAADDREYEKGWREYAADADADAKRDVANTQSAQDQRRLEAEIQWREENNIVVDDNLMVFSPEAGKKYGITSYIETGEGTKVLAIDTSAATGNGPRKLKVRIGDEIVHIEQQYADKMPIEEVNGELVWTPGGSTQTPSGSGNPTSRTNMVMQNLTEENVSDLSSTIKDRMVALEGLPPNVMMGVSDQIIKDIDAAIGKAKANGRELLVQEAYNQIASPVINSGVIELGRMNPAVSNIVVPQFYNEKWARMGQTVGNTINGEVFTEENYRNAIRNNAKALGYNDRQIKQILESY